MYAYICLLIYLFIHLFIHLLIYQCATHDMSIRLRADSGVKSLISRETLPCSVGFGAARRGWPSPMDLTSRSVRLADFEFVYETG